MGKNVKVIKVPSEIGSIRKVSSEILGGLLPYKLDKDSAFDIRLCTEEAVRNAIVHGNLSRKESVVKVSYWIDKGKLNIEVEDEGSGFNLKKVPDPTENCNIMKGSGRGVYLIKKLMDYVDFNEKGNKIRMWKVLK